MPSSLPQVPQTGDEVQRLAERDQKTLAGGDEWGWFPWLYKGPESILRGGAVGPSYTGGNDYNFDYNLDMGPMPDLTQLGDTTIAIGASDFEEEIAEDMAKAGAEEIFLPVCSLVHDQAPQFTNPLATMKRLNKSKDGDAAFTITLDSPDACPFASLTFEKACFLMGYEGYAGGSACKDGIQGVITDKLGNRTLLGIAGYKGGSNTSGWANITLGDAMKEIWNTMAGYLLAAKCCPD